MQSIATINSIAVNGLSGNIIKVEVDLNGGLPKFLIVGLPDQGVSESKERIRSAIKSTGNHLPTIIITANLAPADIKKSGNGFDLPIALSLLMKIGSLSKSEFLEESVFIGELGLDGSIRKVSSVMPSVIGAIEFGYKNIFVPHENAKEASFIKGINVFSVKNLNQVLKFLNSEIELNPEKSGNLSEFKNKNFDEKNDFKYIVGQKHAKRALEIAAAGGHNIIMNGPPGSGKTMLSKALKTILPDLTQEESIEISKIYSISGLLNAENPIITERPFRVVHHTASSSSIIGGGRNAKPGEISLSHKGVLFLDEILEFPKGVLEILRQPLEDGIINVSRVNASFTYPAKFMLLGSMNPCPCGFLTDPDKKCICSHNQIKNYLGKLSGPLVDRIDIFIEVPKVKTEEFGKSNSENLGESSEEIRKRVLKAKEIQLKRFEKLKITSNSEMGTKEINEFCLIDEETNKILLGAVNNMNLSARSYYRILKLARTISDLNEEENISKKAILEALSYRKKDFES